MAAAATAPLGTYGTETLHIVFHGNCIDGWLSAFLAHKGFRMMSVNGGFPYMTIGDVRLWAISPSQEWTWAMVPVKGCHVLLLDVSLPEHSLKAWERTALSVYCVDHHVTSLPAWTGRAGPSLVRTDRCATWLTWELIYPELPPPEWVALVDRIDRWTDVTEEDRAVRELLHPIAQMAVKNQFAEAIYATQQFTFFYNFPSFRALQVEQGMAALAAKDAAFKASLASQPTSMVTLDADLCAAWKVPGAWIGQTVFIINSTGVMMDSTDAAATLFEMYPEVNIFLNYRHKRYVNRKGIAEESVIYSVRAREGSGVDLTAGAVFAGHPCAAGGSKPFEKLVPFVIEAL
jgi:hypothetical protein